MESIGDIIEETLHHQSQGQRQNRKRCTALQALLSCCRHMLLPECGPRGSARLSFCIQKAFPGGVQ